MGDKKALYTLSRMDNTKLLYLSHTFSMDNTKTHYNGTLILFSRSTEWQFKYQD